MSSNTQRFYAYPLAREGPKVPYKNDLTPNPVLRGRFLSVAAWLIENTEFLQRFLYKDIGIDKLRAIKELGDYRQRLDAAVIPISDDPSFDFSSYTDPKAFEDHRKGVVDGYHSSLDFHKLYLSGELTPLDVAKSLLPLIRRDREPQGSHSIAFVDSKVDLVLKAAAESTERYKAGKPLGVLDGVPIGIKDETDVEGYRTYLGRKKNDDLFPIKTETSWPVQQWVEAGAVIVGKLNMHETGADTTNNNLNWGTPRNPYNQNYFPGGSSGGSAWAVATGLVPFAFGADAGGSIRLPAAFCGIYGLKPTQSRVGETKLTMCVSGPLAASVADLELAYRVMAKPDPSHPVGSLFSPPKPVTGERPKVIGIYESWFDRAEPQVQKRCREALDHMVAKMGYTIVPIEIPYLPEGQLAHALTTMAEMITNLKQAFPEHPERHWHADLTKPVTVMTSICSQASAMDYIMAQQMRSLLMSHLAFLYQKHPGIVIVTPTSPIPGWRIENDADLVYGVMDGDMSIRNMEYIYLANFTGCPAITCPVGYVEPAAGRGKGELPVGLMAMGEWGSEDALIEWGRDAEDYLTEVYPGGRRRPENWEDVIQNAKSAA